MRTSTNNRLKISSGTKVPGIEDVDATRKILRQIDKEQKILNQLATRLGANTKVEKHAQHDQKTHGRRGKSSKQSNKKIIPYKSPDSAKSIKLKNLVPAVADLKGNVYVGKRGQIHLDVIEGIKGFDANTFDRGFVDTTQGI